MSKTKQIFIVGSSRSGTTMMGRILGNHRDVFTFNELHFFGTIWVNKSKNKIKKNEQIKLLSRLLCIEEKGLFNQDNISDYYKISEKLLFNQSLTPLEIYSLFLKHVTISNHNFISCEQTPKNIYYLNEILEYFPDSKVINMVRDQRDVLLSQKNKWKRKFLGASKIPFLETIRSYFNYHPILTAKVWNLSLENTIRFKDHDRVIIVKFEELLANPENTINSICSFLGIKFQDEMLAVPVVGSSTEEDANNDLKIDKSKSEKWKKGGLTKAEIYLSQLFSRRMMIQFSYTLEKFDFPPFLTLVYVITFPLKLVVAFFLNITRMLSVFEVINKRFFVK